MSDATALPRRGLEGRQSTIKPYLAALKRRQSQLASVVTIAIWIAASVVIVIALLAVTVMFWT